MNRHIFAAVPLPVHIKNAIHDTAGGLENKVPFKQWVHPDDLHITLSFLGQAEITKVRPLKEILHGELLDIPAFTLTLSDPGFFGKKQQPRIFWLGVEKEPALIELQKKVHHSCEQAGFTLESRAYSPHVTLAKRWKDPDSTINEVFDGQELSSLSGRSFDVNAIVLYETHLDQVPKYKVIEKIPLKGELPDS
ncbi:RNA 2',3'-cyclic phosphodiesterase [Fictibacillus fluitans]|uniref:RNA 2',3'-cyclic phosphodiesterase n=1 Tax=Fictibacillus fluitans TaxID=3058422 RepID=A0ABT8I0K5_9BACL|nr:RNA 2',3'-cyclic phosphodiesterase [Fictibacillus sp. NE201]MDN4526558.1 RNA 2',3'-cyclic phosphodiesterase [Fictibacillus sp. NE201]